MLHLYHNQQEHRYNLAEFDTRQRENLKVRLCGVILACGVKCVCRVDMGCIYARSIWSDKGG